MKIVGITGGIGAGKSTASEFFSKIGIPVYNSDTRAKFLMQNDEELKESIEAIFGAKAYPSGKLDRIYIASQIFIKPILRNKINNLVHPAVGLDFKNWFGAQNSPYVLKEAAILFESGAYKQCDYVINVFANFEDRVRWTKENRNMTREDFLDRFRIQWDDDERAARSDFHINNTEDLTFLEKEVNRVHVKILEKIGSSR